tara:strand:- start:1497 stop:2261 length:765 start_codon:yes stop_codon:yes gene_type:complete
MITRTFLFLPGISKKSEQNLWQQGIHSWDDFLKTKHIKGMSAVRKAAANALLKKAKDALREENVTFFAKLLPLAEHWRMYEYFKEDAAYLDIETEHVTKELTVIGLFDGIRTKTMIAGVNLDLKALQKELAHYKLIITYNGNTFDLPFLRKRYPKLLPNVPTIDLRVVAQRCGYKGGLKQIEKQLDIKRNAVIERISGGDPAKLYRMWKGSGDDHYLQLLVEYNEEDVANLHTIAAKLYKRSGIFIKQVTLEKS